MSGHDVIDNDLDSATREAQIDQIVRLMNKDNASILSFINVQERYYGIMRNAIRIGEHLITKATHLLEKREVTYLGTIVNRLKLHLPLQANIGLGLDKAHCLKWSRFQCLLGLYKWCLASRRQYEAGGAADKENYAAQLKRVEDTILEINKRMWVVHGLAGVSEREREKLGDDESDIRMLALFEERASRRAKEV